ncbi:MAG TPA: sigma-70 family RNA polymerase sigma factor [Acidimicrobiales bacterium]|nr:sigma-70 family RNA polymerase sigma factor [Acidimicrobiales bacterium]
MYEIHYPRVVRALELSGAQRVVAEDAAQEAFARTLGHWRRVRKGPNPPGYVFRTAFRLVRTRLPGVELSGDEATGEERPSPDVADEAVVNVTVEDALAGMPARRRACAVMCFVAGLTPNEAAEALGIEPSTVRKQLEIARRHLQVMLEA